MDIRNFLEKEFEEIRRSHCLSSYLPPVWPDKKSITSLVERSSGHFVYATTVIRYIQSDQHRPDDRLKVVFRLQPRQEQDQPYTQLDALYSLIIRGIEDQKKLEKVCLVLGIVYISQVGFVDPNAYSECKTIERVLGMRAGDVILLLSPILSLVAINNDEVRILHKSLIDYLLDPTRWGHLQIPFDLALAATYILRKKIMANNCAIFEFTSFAYHCRYGYLNNPLRDYLHDLEIPYPKCVKNTLNECSSYFVLLMTHFFRALSRDDFDSTRQYHQRYTAKWISYLQNHTVPPSYNRTPWSNPVTTVDDHRVKVKLDTMLKKWKPKDFKPKSLDGTISARRAAVIEQEHRVWSKFARFRWSSIVSDIVSSLVFGDIFIYGYHLTSAKQQANGPKHFFLTVYARHENACINLDRPDFQFDEIMQDGLEIAAKVVLSDVYQKYGILPLAIGSRALTCNIYSS